MQKINKYKYTSCTGVSYLLACIVLATQMACDNSKILDTKVNFVDHKWHADSLLRFEVYISDTQATYSMLYNIRNGIYFPYYNLFIKYSIYNASDSLVKSDLQEMQLMDAKTGKPYGSGFGATYDHLIFSIKDLKFKKPEKYTVVLQHYMRDMVIEDIHSVGIRMQKNTKEL